MTSDSNPKYYVLTRRPYVSGRLADPMYFQKLVHRSTGVWTSYIGEATLFTEEQAQAWALFQETDSTRMEPWEDPCPYGHDVIINDIRESHTSRTPGNDGMEIEITACLVCDTCGAKMLCDVRGTVLDSNWSKHTSRTIDTNHVQVTDKEQP